MKSSLQGAFLSGLVYPGLGQIIQKHYLRGISLIGIFTASLFVITFAALKRYKTFLANLETGTIEYDITTIFQEASKFTASQDNSLLKYASALIFSCWFIGTVDAYLSGKKTDQGKGVPHPAYGSDGR